MPQTRKRKTKETFNESLVKKGRKEKISLSKGTKNKNQKKPRSSKIIVTKPTINSQAKRKKCENFESAGEESCDAKISRGKKTVIEDGLLPWKDPKLSKAMVVLHPLNLKNETNDSDKSSLNNSIDSGFLSETSIDFSKSDFKVDFIQSEASTSLSKDNIQYKNESSSSESEWEEVEDNCEQSLDDYKPKVLKEGVEITIDCPDFYSRRRKRKRPNRNELIRLRINRIRKDIQLSSHKTHLLCLIAHGIYLNKILNHDCLKAFALSLIPNDILSYTSGKKIDKIDVSGIGKILSWFRKSFIYENEKSVFLNIFSSMLISFAAKKAMNASEYNLMFVILARILGFKVRFCMSLYPVSKKATNLIKKPNYKRIKNSVPDDSDNGKITKEIPEKEINELKSSIKQTELKFKKVRVNKKPSTVRGRKNNCPKAQEKTKKRLSRPRRSTGKKYKYSSDEGEDNSDDDKDFKISDEDDFESSNDESGYIEDVKVNRISKRSGSRTKHSNRGKKYEYSNDEDFEISDDEGGYNEVVKVKRISKRSSRPRPKRSNRKVLSSDSPPEQSVLGYESIVCWAEVYLKPNKQWVSIECSNNIINKPFNIEALAPQPVSYILAFDNESHVKDVTRRYCSEYMTSNVKLRIDSEWWEHSLKPFLPPNSIQDKEEEKKLEELLVNKPLPTTVQGFKRHPMYVLKRHLLQFEAVYPPDAPPVGFFKGEPVYARDCVFRLRPRERWLREGRLVKVGEEPYKIVITKICWDRINHCIKRGDIPVESFGIWQTDPYEAPVAENGKVPRNEYGNVDLYKPSMLPKGTVHLRLPGLNRIAKKLNIDCSPAVTGFNLYNSSIYPTFDGFVVCKEFKDKILAAWNKEQEDAKKRKEEKREKRIYGNWKKLIKGLLIRERLKLKYDIK